MPTIAPWLPYPEVPRGIIYANKTRDWDENELLAKHVRLGKELQRLVGEGVSIAKGEKVSAQLFDTMCARVGKGLPAEALSDDDERNSVVEDAKSELEKYRRFHKNKMLRYKKLKNVVNATINKWQQMRKEVREMLVEKFDWDAGAIPDEITLDMHFQSEKWDTVNRTIIEQDHQKYDYAHIRFSSEKKRNQWLVHYEAQMCENLSFGRSYAIDKVMELQDEHFGPDMSDYVLLQDAERVFVTKVGPDGSFVNEHFDPNSIDINQENLTSYFTEDI